MEVICRIEVVRIGREFAVRAHLNEGTIKEYRHPNFEEAVTEMVIDLQGLLEE